MTDDLKLLCRGTRARNTRALSHPSCREFGTRPCPAMLTPSSAVRHLHRSRVLREELPSACTRTVIVVRESRLPAPSVLSRFEGAIRVSTAKDACRDLIAPVAPCHDAPAAAHRREVALWPLQSCRSHIEYLELQACGLAADGALEITTLLDPLGRGCANRFAQQPDGPRGACATSASDLPHSQSVEMRRGLGGECGIHCVLGVSTLEAAHSRPCDSMSALQELDIGHNAIGTIPALFSAIGRLPRLRSLRLSHNKLGQTGCTLLCGALATSPSCQSLCTLDISANSVGDEGMKSVASILGKLSVLTSLSASHNGIGDPGVDSLCRGLEVCSQLHDLDLRGNVITDQGERTVSAMLRRRTAILRVDLCNNRIGPEGENWCF
jgi:hypothetical protein